MQCGVRRTGVKVIKMCEGELEVWDWDAMRG